MQENERKLLSNFTSYAVGCIEPYIFQTVGLRENNSSKYSNNTKILPKSKHSYLAPLILELLTPPTSIMICVKISCKIFSTLINTLNFPKRKKKEFLAMNTKEIFRLKNLLSRKEKKMHIIVAKKNIRQLISYLKIQRM